MLRPKALNHVALSVTDLDKTLCFYQLLGLELLRTSGPNTDGGRAAVLKVCDQEINVFCKPGLVSIDDLIADLRQAGVSIFRGPVERRDGTSVFVYDPDGVRVELRLEK